MAQYQQYGKAAHIHADQTAAEREKSLSAIRYSATTDDNSWRMTINDGFEPEHVVQSGKFMSTSGEIRDAHITVSFPGTVYHFQVITSYQGAGTFTVKAIGIRPR